MTETITWFCGCCEGEREFCQPLCDDGHDADCPEWLCQDCGYAVLVGWTVEPSAAEIRPAA